MSSLTNSAFPAFPTFSASFSKKDNKYDISVLFISFITFCALSTFCWIIFAINFTGWLFVTVIGGTITKCLTKCREELIKPFDGKKTKVENMLDHRLSSSHFEEFRLHTTKDGLPSIPSYRSSTKPNKVTSNKVGSKLSFDFSNPSLYDDIKPEKNKTILAPSEYSLKRNEKRTKSIKHRHVPDIPSQLSPNRQKEEWKSDVDYYPSVRHSHQPKLKSKLSATEKMIESTAAYRVGKKCNGWMNGSAEEFVINNQEDPITDCTSYDDPFHSREPIKDLNVRLDQERPKITKQERRTYNTSPANSLQYARQYLTVFLTVKKEMNL